MDKTALLVLAAGKGKRMKAAYPKVLARTREDTLLGHVLSTAAKLPLEPLVLIVGHKHEMVTAEARQLAQQYSISGKLKIAQQLKQLGTGHAVRCALPQLQQFSGNVVILYGDVPLIKACTLRNLVSFHKKNKATVSLISFYTSKANRYGRVLRKVEQKKAPSQQAAKQKEKDQAQQKLPREATAAEVLSIIEFADCSVEEANICEYNSGIYCVEASFLQAAVGALSKDNAQGEYYLTDIVAAAVRQQKRVAAMFLDDEREVLGVNSSADLIEINKALNMRKIEELVENGVELVDPASVYVDPQVQVAAGVRIGPNVQLLGNTKVAAGVVFEGSAYIKDTTIESGAIIRFNVRCEQATVGKQAQVGPFAHLRSEAVLEANVQVGNFVEVKNSTLESGAKAKHLSYLGNCQIGSKTNIGAGTITCNYDGYRKPQTCIGKNVSVGADSTLVAPLKIGDGAIIGAGSTIRDDVAADALALTVGKVVLRSDWAKHYRQKNSPKKGSPAKC